MAECEIIKYEIYVRRAARIHQRQKKFPREEVAIPEDECAVLLLRTEIKQGNLILL
jgi:hypothetical protein